MFDVFGNFDSVEELNACAKGLLEEQDLEHLKVLAEENGIPDGIREVYEQHLSEELVDLVNAALGKLQIELKEETDGMPAGEIVSYLSMRCFEKETLAKAVRRKNRTLKECLKHIRKETEEQIQGQMEVEDYPELMPDAPVMNLPEEEKQVHEITEEVVQEGEVIEDILKSGDPEKIIQLLKKEFAWPKGGWDNWKKKVITL